MSKGGISLNDINARLGAQNSRRRDDYDDFDSKSPAQNYGAQDDDSEKMSTGFIATMVAAFLAIGGGTFLFAGGGMSMPKLNFSNTWGGEEYVSRVDANCKPLWVPSARNDAALACYLTTNIKRLCDSNEVAHLAKIMKRYRMDIDTRQASAMVGGLRMGLEGSKLSAEFMTDMAKSGAVIIPKTKAQAAKNEELMMDAGMKLAGKMANLEKSLSSLINTSGSSRIDPKVLAGYIRNIAEKGYMAKWDFGWLADPLVDAGFANAKPAQEPKCEE